MKLGIKVGPQKQSFKDLVESNAPFAEVWFNIAAVDDYDELFDLMKKRTMDVGLHFWGTLDNDIEVNISYPETTILESSRKLIQQCIDIAAQHTFQYVNIHPGGRILTKINFSKEAYIATELSTDQYTCEEVFTQSLRILSDYAINLGVQLMVESIPPYDPGSPWSNPASRTHPVRNHQMPLGAFEKIIPTIRNLGFANDLGHTASQVISDTRDPIFQFLQEKTLSLASVTKLIHIGYIIPPYIGTDYHGNIYDPICKTQLSVPNTSELRELLQLFTKRDDVFALVEPPGNHVKNYEYVKKLLDEDSCS